MLKKKLKLSSGNSTNEIQEDDMTSRFFSVPLWKKIVDIENAFNKELRNIQFESTITHIYNPLEYASDLHCAYLRKFLDGPKKVMFVGMNPGPNGMGQTGVPFGNIQTVRDWMKLKGNVEQPSKVHPKRPVDGLNCHIEEPSGVRLWGVLKEISGDLEVFAKQCYVDNFCPLLFFDNHGRNITPSELKRSSKKDVVDICQKALEEKINLVNPEIVIAIGGYVGACLKNLQKQENFKQSDKKFLQLPHPSPRSLNNINWPEKAKIFFEQNDLMKYLKNEI